MPERHRHHDSTERRELFTITLESCSRSGGIRVHDEVETVITMSRNMQAPSLSIGSRRRQSDRRLPSTPTGIEGGVLLDGPTAPELPAAPEADFNQIFFAP
jgi:hypothetical protein